MKIGGNVIDDDVKLSSFLDAFAAIGGHKILVHGGGKLATRLATSLGINQQLIDGRRITDAETLKVVTMVYAGYINKNIVSLLQSKHCNAIGLCGADANTVLAHKRTHDTIDYGFVGDVDTVDISILKLMLEQDITVVFAPITHNKKGVLLNTNADTVANEIAKALSADYEVTLIFAFEKNGVLYDANDDHSVISAINQDLYRSLKEKRTIFAGMIPKLENAFAALEGGVKKVVIGSFEQIDQLVTNTAGTTISHE